MKKLIAVLLVMHVFTGTQLAQSQYNTREIAYLYDLDSATETFCAMELNPIQGTAQIQTSGSSTTVTAVSGSPFAEVSTNDKLVVTSVSATAGKRAVVAKASSTSITIDTALNIAGSAFNYTRVLCGTTATDGWFSMYRRPGVIDINIGQLNVTGGIDVRVQCATTAGFVRQVYPALTPPTSTASFINFTAVGGMAISVPDPWDRCRVGMKIGTSDDGGDLTTNREQISINLELGQ